MCPLRPGLILQQTLACKLPLLESSCHPAVKVRIGGAAKKRARESSAIDAESMGAPGRSTNAQSDPLAVLGDAGMVLRDPATMRLIIHHVSPCCA